MQKSKDVTETASDPYENPTSLINQITKLEEMIRLNEIIIRDTGRRLRLNQKELASLKDRLIKAYEKETPK